MRIGFIYPPFDPLAGSFGQHGYHVAREFVGRGHEIHVLGSTFGASMIGHEPTRMGKLRLLHNVDVLYIRVGFLHWRERLTWLRCVRPGVRVVWELNAPSEEALMLESFRDAPAALRRDMQRKRRMARFVDAAVCVSDTMADYARERFGIKRSIVAPNGGDPTAFDRLGAERTFLATLKDRFIVMWAGDPSLPWQAVEHIVEAAAICRDTAPDVLFCMLLSKESHARLPLASNILALQGTDIVTARRYLRDAHAALAVYHTYAWCPVGFYGSSLKLFESMAAGKPTIATDIGQSQDVMRNGVDGLLVPADGRGIASAVCQLRRDPDLCRRLGETARRRIEATYTWRHTVDRIESLLLDVVETRHRPLVVPSTIGVEA